MSIRANKRIVNYKTIKFILKYLHEGVLKPTSKAFLFAYIYVVLPKLIDHLIVSIKKKRWNDISPRFMKVILNAFHPNKFPVFAASLVAGINILEPIVYAIFKKHSLFKIPTRSIFFATLISSFISAAISFPRFQNHILGYGRYYSLDLTLLVVTRALDTALSSSLSVIMPHYISRFGDVALFIASCTPIMFAWFYTPEKLPPAYRNWITSAANMDDELIEALRRLRDGSLVYGEHGPYETILLPICERHNQDPSRASLIVHQPVECELVHEFKTKNCEIHALWRFVRGFSFAIKLYGPLNVLVLLFPAKGSKFSARVIRAMKASVRSSVFLGAYISLYWYAVCLSRSRLLPYLFPKKPRTDFDITIGPSAGAFLCGFSSLIETAQRRKELALFVAPRALGTFVPTEASKINLKIESLVFSVSLAVLVAYSRSDPSKVRGIFGKGLKQVFNIGSYN
ncbi:hypothetical protein DFJ63DRAFT_310611 [Scheffersomyces coipomensis]|uniref:uncharacterized protein n=1 Tax=Scheffersomyces coipomensis TaxID=1788519 RepID=UPI00315C9A16